MPEPRLSRVRKANLRDAIAQRQQASKSAGPAVDKATSGAGNGVTPGLDEALLEERVRDEIARQLKRGDPKGEPARGHKASLDVPRLREAVRREVRRQFGFAGDAAATAPTGAVGDIDSELLRAAIQKVLSRQLHRQGERKEPGERTRSLREVSPAVLEPLVRKELDRLLGRAGQAPDRATEGNVPDPAILRERIREAMAALLSKGKEPGHAQVESGRVTYPERAVIAKQVRIVLKRCLSRPALPEGRPLSDEAIDEMVKDALRGLAPHR
jgi:hypothetical protein